MPEHEVTQPLVIVLNDDNNLEALKGRSLGDVDQEYPECGVSLRDRRMYERSFDGGKQIWRILHVLMVWLSVFLRLRDSMLHDIRPSSYQPLFQRVEDT